MSAERYSTHVWKKGHWPFAWAFIVHDEATETAVYGEQHIESRRAAQKDADDIVTRLGDGRLRLSDAGVVYAPQGGR